VMKHIFIWMAMWTSRIYVWASEHRHNIMETLIHPEEYMVWCALSTSCIVGPVFFLHCYVSSSLPPCPPRIISPISSRNGCHFWRNIFQQDKVWPHTHTHTRARTHTHTLWMQCLMCSVSILMIESCVIVFLNGSDMGGHGRNTVQILTHAIIFYGAFWKIQFTKTIRTQLKNWKKIFWRWQWSASVKKHLLQLCEISDVGCRWLWMPMVCIQRILWHDDWKPE
jgi:hypothetical protein